MEDYELEIYVEPIFKALIKNNAPLELMRKVFIDTNLPQYFEYLPDDLKNEPGFIKECLEKNLITMQEVPKGLLNQDFISKELYLSNISHYVFGITTEVYPQDEEIVKTILKTHEIAYEKIKEEFKNNEPLMMECLQENTRLFGLLSNEFQENFLNNKELIKETLKNNPAIYMHLREDQKGDPEILKIVLSATKGLSMARDYLKHTKDPEVALKALEIDNGASKYLHQKYASIIKQHKVTDNRHNFLKIFLSQEELQKILPVNENKGNTKPKL